MIPILGRYGPFFLYSYQVIWGLGLGAGLWLVYRQSPPPRRARDWLDPLLVALAAGAVVGRLAFVWVNGDYFQLHPQEGWMLWRGGLSYHGVLFGSLGALALWGAWRGPAPARLAGPLALLLPWLHAVGWTACLLEGCGYGRPAAAGLFVAELPDSFGVLDLRAATQVAGIALGLTVLALAYWRLRAGGRPGRTLWLALAVLGAGGAALGAWRDDASPLVGTPAGTLRLDQLLDASLAVAAMALAIAAPGPAGTRASPAPDGATA